MHIAEPLGHVERIERLWNAARSGRLPHALLFEGPEGIGKYLAACWFAAGLLCAEHRRSPGPPCRRCGPCKRVVSDNHPDLFAIDPDSEGAERILIERIALRADGDPERCLESFLDLRAMEGGSRAVLLRSAHLMNDNAQGALLKTLEEPRPGTVLVLETHLPARLLATIRSRCVPVRFDALGPQDCERALAGAGLGSAAGDLARWTEGSPGRAVAWHARNAPALLQLLSACFAGGRPALAIAAATWEVEGQFPGTKPSVQARERARFVLDLALLLLRDALRFDSGVPAASLALGAFVEPCSGRGTRELRRALDAVLVCRGDVDRNLTPEAVVERALLAWEEPGRIVEPRRS